jgi:oligo-1,6-glucosidase
MVADTRTTSDPWWKAAVVYQVYPRSFADSDGDGVGDLRGIIDRLPHLDDLGVDVLWLSPVYRSPQDDNGYDISDYQDIDPTFGTLSDLDELLEQLHGRGMRLVMDLVVNHTSDEHPWFEESRRDRANPKADWYIWREGRPGGIPGEKGAEPNNWASFFSGSAWQWCPAREQYYLHLFSRKQPDLNWENPEVRAAVHAMMRWWLGRGVDGFRMDVINLISKDPALPDGELLTNGYGDGMPHYSYGPRVHEFLAEMRREVFESRPGSYLTVGEMPGVTTDQALRFTDRESGQLDMVFQFEHVALDQDRTKWNHRPLALTDLKASLGRWQTALGDRGWNSLYWNNHDQPRAVSRFGNDTVHRQESAKALGTVLHLHRGTPFVYQGEELGMTNVPFNSIDDFEDIESVNHFQETVALGADPAEVLVSLRRTSRDNARTPMQWDSSAGAGFTTGVPWLHANPNHVWLNVEAQRADPASVLNHYKALVALRHSEPAVVDGDFRMLLPDHPSVYAYERRLDEQCLRVYANLSDEPVTEVLPQGWDEWQLLLANVPEASGATAGPTLSAWEARVYRVR